MHKPSLAQQFSAPGGGRRLKPLSIVSSLGLTLATMTAGITATATAETIPNPTPNNPSVYEDNYGRNVVGPEALPKLNPSVEGGSTTVSVGDETEYKFVLDTGFPEDPGNVTGQRWVKITLTEDPQVPFEKNAEGMPLVEGLTEGSTLAKVGEHTWEAILGEEFLDIETQGETINNPSHAEFDPEEAVAWEPPAELTLTIPAKVASDEGEKTFAKGKAEVTSGRLVVLGIEDSEIIPRFVSNDGEGKCTWEATYDATLTGQDAGNWLKAIRIASDPQRADIHFLLPDEFKGIKPEFLEGLVSINGEEKFLMSDVPHVEKDDWTDTVIGEFETDPNIPPFYSYEWLPAESNVTVDFEYTNPCGRYVNADFVAEREGYGQGLSRDSRVVRDLVYVYSNRAEMVISRPPEDVTASAEYSFMKEESFGGTPPVNPENPEDGDTPPVIDGEDGDVDADGQDPSITPTGSSFGWLIPLIGLIGGGGAILGSSIASTLPPLSSGSSEHKPEGQQPKAEKLQVDHPAADQPAAQQTADEQPATAGEAPASDQPVSHEGASEQVASEQPQRGLLANTGVSVLAPLFAGVVLLIMGAALAIIRRRA